MQFPGENGVPHRGPTSRRLRTLLLLLVSATAVPLLGFGLLNTYLQYRADRVEDSRQTIELARSMALSTGGELQSAINALEVLGLSPRLIDGDFESFRSRADAFVRQQQALALAVTDREGRILFATTLPRGAAAVRTRPATSARVFAFARPEVSNLEKTNLVVSPVVEIDVPVMQNARVVFDLTLLLSPSRFTPVIAHPEPRGSSIISLFDAAGITVARVPDAPAFIGRRAPASLFNELMGKDEGTHPDLKFEGVPLMTGWSHIAPFGWSLAIGLPDRELSAPGLSATAAKLASGGAVLALGLVFAAVIARRIIRPIASLARVAEAAGGDERLMAPATGLVEVDEVAARLGEIAVRRRVAERDTQRAQAWATRLLETSPGAILQVSPSGKVIYANPAAEQLLGLTVGTNAGFRDLFAWAAREPATETSLAVDDLPISHALAGRVVRDAEIMIEGPDGHPLVLLINAAPLRQGDGSIGGALLAMIDVTTRHDAERERQKFVGLLEERIRTEVAAREAAQTAALQAQKMQALGQLAGGIAHDMNNVLQSISGALALIEKRTEGSSVLRLVRLATDSAERGAGVVRRLLAFSRRGELRAEFFEPGAIVAGLAEMLTHTLGAVVVMRTEIAPDLPSIHADRTQLETVLLNLANNARDAMPNGGALTLKVAADVVDASDPAKPIALTPGAYVRFEVSDDGLGMDAATLERAGEPFFTTKPLGKGTGLGLAMARGFAEQSGGGLAIESAPGRGTTVRLWLPRVEDAALGARQAPDLAAAERATDTSPRVLLVDDEPLVRDMLACELQDHGCAVVAAADGPSAMEMMEAPASKSIDVLVADLAMPGMNGLTLIREARQRRPNLPAILLTGHGGAIESWSSGCGLPAGRFTLLRKPVSGERLADGIAVLLSSS